MARRKLALKLAEKTVKNYVSTILSKLEVGRRAEATAYLARHSVDGVVAVENRLRWRLDDTKIRPQSPPMALRYSADERP